MRIPKGGELRTTAAMSLVAGLFAWDMAGFGLPLDSTVPQDATRSELNVRLQAIEQPTLIKFGTAIAKFVHGYNPLTSPNALVVTALPNGYEDVLIGGKKGRDSYSLDAIIDEVGAADGAPEATQSVQTDVSFKSGTTTITIEDKLSQQGIFTAYNSFTVKTPNAPPKIKNEVDVPGGIEPSKVPIAPGDTEYVYTPDQAIQLQGDAQITVNQETRILNEILPPDK